MLDLLRNEIVDVNYSQLVPNWGFPRFDHLLPQIQVKKWLIDKLMEFVFGKPSVWQSNQTIFDKTVVQTITSTLPVKEQLKQLIAMPDEQYSDKMLNADLRKYLLDLEKDYQKAMADYKSHIAPSYWEVQTSHVNISWIFAKSYYTQNYPSYVDFLWTRDLLWFYAKWDLSWFIFPADDADIQSIMKRRATQLKAEMWDLMNKGITMDTELEVEYRDVEEIRQKLATKEERYFETSFYTTIYNTDKDKLVEDGKRYEQKMSWFGIGVKPASHRMDEWITSTLPMQTDDLWIYRSTLTTSLGWSFPFITSDLIDDNGIFYGVNLHTWGLIIFDRFSKKLPNANAVVLATSGAGKSFTVKLEILRYLLHWIDIIVIDPENEYQGLIDKVWGTYVNIAINSNQFINPFDLPPRIEDVEYGPWDLLRSQILWLIWLVSTLIGWCEPEEEALLDKALQQTYALKWITFDLDDYGNKTPPLMQDLLAVLESMNGWDSLAIRVSKYVTGTFAKLFNNYTNVDLSKWLTVFSIRDIEDSLKTPAMYNVLNYIWAKVRSQKIKRMLVVDEAWIMLQSKVSADFLYGIIKRARKYWLWVTTISQDVDDFLRSEYGKPIVTNSALQILLKQSTASIKWLEAIFGLSDAEKEKLVSSNIGEWLLFAWNQHVAMRVLASSYEKDFVSSWI